MMPPAVMDRIFNYFMHNPFLTHQITRAIALRQKIHKEMELKSLNGSIGNTVKINDPENLFFYYNGSQFEYKNIQFLSIDNQGIQHNQISTFIETINDKLSQVNLYLKHNGVYPVISRFFCQLTQVFGIFSLVMIILLIHFPLGNVID